MKQKEIIVKVLQHIQKEGHVTFLEIERLFKMGGFPYKGSLPLCSASDENILYWNGWNKGAIRIIRKILRNEAIVIAPTDTITYVIDGGGLDLPIARKADEQYKVPHWLPITLNVSK
jgi:hypothetical protein